MRLPIERAWNTNISPSFCDFRSLPDVLWLEDGVLRDLSGAKPDDR